jgi:hypothetical protein
MQSVLQSIKTNDNLNSKSIIESKSLLLSKISPKENINDMNKKISLSLDGLNQIIDDSYF